MLSSSRMDRGPLAVWLAIRPGVTAGVSPALQVESANKGKMRPQRLQEPSRESGIRVASSEVAGEARVSSAGWIRAGALRGWMVMVMSQPAVHSNQ